MVVRAIKVWVRLSEIQAFERATRANHEGSLSEPGVVRFDVLKHEQNPGEYLLYEMYRSPAAALAHKETEHYQVWRDTVAPMMERSREGTPYDVLLPLEP